MNIIHNKLPILANILNQPLYSFLFVIKNIIPKWTIFKNINIMICDKPARVQPKTIPYINFLR
jgi:hypothetical protein